VDESLELHREVGEGGVKLVHVRVNRALELRRAGRIAEGEALLDECVEDA
jgi:hypothetical protein